MSIGEAFDRAFAVVRRERRPEYVYKNAIVSKIVLGRHSALTSSAGLEVAMGRSAADVLVLNGTSTVYEIKTDLDSFARLSSQLRDYSAVAEHVVVVTSDRRAAAAEALLPSHVGLLGLRTNGSLATYKQSTGGTDRLDPIAIHRVLRKFEVLEILEKNLGITSITAGRYSTETRQLLSLLPVDVLHAEALTMLRRRFSAARPLVVDETFPHSLRALAYGTPLSPPRQRALAARLSLPVTTLGVSPSA